MSERGGTVAEGSADGPAEGPGDGRRDGPLRCLAVADFNPGNLEAALLAQPGRPELRVDSLALNGPLGPGSFRPGEVEGRDAGIVWTRPEAQVPGFADLLAGGPAEEDPLEGVDRFAERIARVAPSFRWTFVPTWTLPPGRRAFSLLDMKPGAGVELSLLRMNLRLADRLAGVEGVHLLEARRWMERAGGDAYHPKLWYMARVPFGPEVFREAASAIKGALRALTGCDRKLIVLDLDGTLWGGVVGQVGREGLRLGGHDPVGEAYADFQRALRSFLRRGVVLGVVSRNDEDFALETIREHPEMVLRPEDFAGWRIGWGDKAEMLLGLLDDLALGPEAAVYIDDDPAQRARIRDALPEVEVPEWPSDPARYREALLGLPLFDAATLSREDRARGRMYAARRQREDSRRVADSVESWLRGLETVVRIEPLRPDNEARAAQLLARTNQMNLTTRRLSRPELRRWAAGEGREVWLFRVSDRFGDMGICGLLGLELDSEPARIVDFLLSCRVLGRRVETLMAALAVERAAARGRARVRARLVETPRNAPCRQFWEASGFEKQEPEVFEWDASRDYPRPSPVRVEGPEAPGAPAVPASGAGREA